MKNILRKLTSLRVLALMLVISVASVQESQAFVWFGADEANARTVAEQWAYADTCVKIIEVDHYFFGIKTYTEFREVPFRCIKSNPD
jgi:hypothetical protein